MRLPALAAALALLAGCGSREFDLGRRYEDSQRHPLAIKAYESFAAGHPDDPRTAEALVRAARIYAKTFNRCLEARRHYETALRRFPDLEPWASQAKAGLMACPDYFPIDQGRRWTFGDTASLGKNMRLDIEVKKSSGSVSGEMSSRLFAGAKTIKSEELVYVKKDWAVVEIGPGRRVPILRYPFRAGNSWKERSGSEGMEYLIESADAVVKTGAGVFRGCLKVKETNTSFPDVWKYDYYAPYVGRIKTTIAGPGFENPNTELIDYSPR
ncbi:MAG: tetratricopeptide repeat protein [Elusimicrobia bacterium]|nr:tetratricopeptide repeat protein [Elusimicrobiota bacterium]